MYCRDNVLIALLTFTCTITLHLLGDRGNRIAVFYLPQIWLIRKMQPLENYCNGTIERHLVLLKVIHLLITLVRKTKKLRPSQWYQPEGCVLLKCQMQSIASNVDLHSLARLNLDHYLQYGFVNQTNCSAWRDQVARGLSVPPPPPPPSHTANIEGKSDGPMVRIHFLIANRTIK